jgi:hypothetical protein
VTIHRCRGQGYDVFRAAFVDPKRQISVFFHRGDSPGVALNTRSLRNRSHRPSRLDRDDSIASDISAIDTGPRSFGKHRAGPDQALPPVSAVRSLTS